MTSPFTDAETSLALARYAEHPMLAELIGRTGCRITEAATGVQALIAAYTHSSEGRPKRIFARAFGKENSVLPLPGGHGRNFKALRRIYGALRNEGKKFAYLTNVDNLGSTVDPVELALLALSGKKAAFDFSYRTPVDVKGGILVFDQFGRMNCADIGAAISLEEVLRAEKGGTPLLFNCATGIFDLEYLTDRIGDIVENLPTRFSDQDKDAGRYSQAEQVTWEIIGMLDDFLIFAVDKYDRFLANKLLVENLLMSGIGAPGRLPGGTETAGLGEVAAKLRSGLEAKLAGEYGMALVGKRWVPLSVDALLARLSGRGA
jgi:UTP--glucose-1-phosphate uridylyltransferase